LTAGSLSLVYNCFSLYESMYRESLNCGQQNQEHVYQKYDNFNTQPLSMIFD